MISFVHYFLQLFAVIAIHSLVNNCGIDKILPFGKPIVASLLVLLLLKVHSLQFSLSTSHCILYTIHMIVSTYFHIVLV
jgi:hypothetical protein